MIEAACHNMMCSNRSRFVELCDVATDGPTDTAGNWLAETRTS